MLRRTCAITTAKDVSSVPITCRGTSIWSCRYSCIHKRASKLLPNSITVNKPLTDRTQDLRYCQLELGSNALVSKIGNEGLCALDLDQVGIIANKVYPRRPTRPVLNATS